MSLSYTILLYSSRQFLLSVKEFRELWTDRSYFLSLQNYELDPTPHIHANLFSKFDSSTKQTELQDCSSVSDTYVQSLLFPCAKIISEHYNTFAYLPHINFLPAVRRRHQGLENVPEIEGEGGVSCRNTQAEVQQLPGKALRSTRPVPSDQAPTDQRQM